MEALSPLLSSGLLTTTSNSLTRYIDIMKYASVELSIDRAIVRLTFETVPEGYERFQRVTIQADDLFMLLVHVDEQTGDETFRFEQVVND